MNNKLYLQHLILLSLCIPYTVIAHDTTHIHPLITSRIAKLIKTVDEASDNAYQEIYEKNPDPIISENLPVDDQFLYWGTDFDPLGSSTTNLSEQEYYGDVQLEQYSRYDNVIDGVVQEDVPFTKVFNHFYHATTGSGFKLGGATVGQPSSVRAMKFFNEAIDWMGGYHEEAKGAAFFTFGQALHHVEDMIIPAPIHNDVENALFVPMPRYGQLKNTHVEISTLRFLNSPCLALKQIDQFSKEYS